MCAALAEPPPSKPRTTTPRARLLALSEDRQAQLLDPAEAEFAAFGFEAASLNRILSAAGMSKGQAYYYVADKADLYDAVMSRALDRLVAALDFGFAQPQSADEFWSDVTRFLERLTEVFLTNDRLATLARSAYEGPQAQAALAEPLGRIRAALETLITLGQSVGAVRADLPQSLLSAVVFALAREIDHWFAEHWRELSPDEAVRLNQRTTGMIRALTEPPDAG